MLGEVEPGTFHTTELLATSSLLGQGYEPGEALDIVLAGVEARIAEIGLPPDWPVDWVTEEERHIHGMICSFVKKHPDCEAAQVKRKTKLEQAAQSEADALAASIPPVVSVAGSDCLDKLYDPANFTSARTEPAKGSPEWRSIAPYSMGWITDGGDAIFGLVKVEASHGVLSPYYICPLFEPTGLVADAKEREPGIQIRWRSAKGRVQEAIIPGSDLHAEAPELARTMMRLGFQIRASKEARLGFQVYLSEILRSRTIPMLTTVSACGMHRIDGENVFVLPSRSCGTKGDLVIFNDRAAVEIIACHGQLAQWQEGVAAPLAVHSRGVVAIALAFAGPIISLLNHPAIGLHFHGKAAGGKTTITVAAASVWGLGDEGGNTSNGHSPAVRSWGTTANGVEATAAQASGTLLALDEISRADPKQVQPMIYGLFGGSGKTRMTTGLTERHRDSWKIALISTGEQPTDAYIEAATTQKARAGTQTRLINVAAAPIGGSGVYDGSVDVGIFSKGIREVCRKHYGHAGQAFVERMMRDCDASKARAEALQEAFSASIGASANGQANRVASTFGVIAAAGELAIEWGILPWATGTAQSAAKRLFEEWMTANGGGLPIEDVQALAVLRLHIEEYGESQFSEIIQESANSYLKAGFGDTTQRADHFQRTKDDPDSIPPDMEGGMVAGEKHARAIKQSGFRDCNQAGQKTFYFYPNGWNVLFSRSGLDGGEAAKAVLAAGFLVTQAGGKLQIKKRTQPGRAQGAIRVYAVKGSILEGP